MSSSTPTPVFAEPKNTGSTSARPVWSASSGASGVGDARLVVEVRGEDRVVVLGEQLGQRRDEAGSSGPTA